MKKKILGGLAVLAIAVVAAFNVNVNVQEEGLSDISLTNVEVLAYGESFASCAYYGCTMCWYYNCHVYSWGYVGTCYGYFG